MKYYKLRIDTSLYEETFEFLKRYSPETLLMGIEKTGTLDVHIHAYLETRIAAGTIRTAIRRRYGSGNGNYSLKDLDEKRPIEYLAYCIKDKEYKHHGFDDTALQTIQDYDDDVKDEIKRKKNRKQTQLQRLMQDIAEEKKEFDDIRDISQYVVDYYNRNLLLVKKFQLVSLTQTLALQHIENYDHDLATAVADLC